MPEIRLNKPQLKLAANFFTDLAKVWFASGVIGFFIPGIAGKPGIGLLIGSVIASVLSFLLGISLLRSINNSNI
jgi:hypothetical protein